MIQRIQTLFYFLAAGAFISMFYLPFATSDKKTDNVEMLADQMYSVEDHMALGILTLIGGILALVTIFLFKNRPLQLRLGNILIILSILIVIATVLVYMQESPNISDSVTVSAYFGLGLPIASIVLAALGNRFVRKDHKLVRSMDRLR